MIQRIRKRYTTNKKIPNLINWGNKKGKPESTSRPLTKHILASLNLRVTLYSVVVKFSNSHPSVDSSTTRFKRFWSC